MTESLPYAAAQMKECEGMGQMIHLHEDVWRAKTEIVRCRLMTRLGHVSSRIFARKTTVQRIDAPTAMGFLEQHHLWGATKAKYYYGLFSKNNKEGELVAVATFSSRRKVIRGGQPHRSHELVRFCARRDGVVVGGITKLIKAFTLDQKPDDIITVVDRDWGPGDGWHQLGFETVHVMPPLVMAVSSDGTRRHLVGAGIRNEEAAAASKGRTGLPSFVLSALEKCGNKPDAAIACLSRHHFYPVYDTGVERLIMVVPNSLSATHTENKGSQELNATMLWESSVPSYAKAYYSTNPGIFSLLKQAEEHALKQTNGGTVSPGKAARRRGTTDAPQNE